MNNEKRTAMKMTTWREIEEFQGTVDNLLERDNLEKMVLMMKNLDYSTIPDDVNYNDEEWLRKKAEAKAAAKLKSDGT